MGGGVWGAPGDGGGPRQAGGESAGLITVAKVWYAQNALETRNQNHKAFRLCVVVFFMVMFFFGLQRLVIYVIKNSVCHIFNFFLYLLAVSLLLSGQAPPLDSI
jgi:hypothetical protein